MPSDRKPSPILPVAEAMLVLLGLYIGAYYGLASPVWISCAAPAIPRYWYEPDTGWGSPAGFGKIDSSMNPFFKPIHAIDRQLRPAFWGPTCP